VLIAVILFVVVGPERLPKLMKTVGKTMRTVRQAGRDIRASVGIDEMMREDFDLRRQPPRRIAPPAPDTISREQETKQLGADKPDAQADKPQPTASPDVPARAPDIKAPPPAGASSPPAAAKRDEGEQPAEHAGDGGQLGAPPEAGDKA
jgi:sec-independent protein translocase protein TatB